MSERLDEFLQKAGYPCVCVVGDVMLDAYVWGEVARISPEGPIPVLHAQRRELRPGGAGSVAAMLAALGAKTLLVGVAGKDTAGKALQKALKKAAIDASGLVCDEGRPTTTKTRYMGYVQSAGRALQQLLRVDEEELSPLPAAVAQRVRSSALARMKRADVLVIQDMGKGLFNQALLADLIAAGRRAGKPVIVDPERSNDYGRYAGATCVLPNRFEAELATGMPLRRESDYARAARNLLQDLSLDAVVIKLDREGMYCLTRSGKGQLMTTRAREVADVTGAGDMVTAAMALALGCGASYETAVALANYAAGVEVSLHGAAPVPREHLIESLRAESDPAWRKIKSRKEIVRIVQQLKQAGKKIVFTNGCFDLLHLGHVGLIRFARSQGDVLIVGLNSDESARKLKGPGRPVNSVEVRARVLASLSDVDYVVVFAEESVLSLIRQVRPDVLVKGGDYTREGVVGHEFVESYGGVVKLAPHVKGFSTTNLLDKIAGKSSGAARNRSAPEG